MLRRRPAEMLLLFLASAGCSGIMGFEEGQWVESAGDAGAAGDESPTAGQGGETSQPEGGTAGQSGADAAGESGQGGRGGDAGQQSGGAEPAGAGGTESAGSSGTGATSGTAGNGTAGAESGGEQTAGAGVVAGASQGGQGNAGGTAGQTALQGGAAGAPEPQAGAAGATITIEDLLLTCGNGSVDPGEDCDDGNVMVGDGCSRLCQLETDHVCGEPGDACTQISICNDGIVTTPEQCDDGNQTNSDGCNANCQLEDGYAFCINAGFCVPLCGDGRVLGTEHCDDNNLENGDGCSASCQIEAGFTCQGEPSRCSAPRCGNGTREAGEECDRGNQNGLLYADGDGCTLHCTNEPNCRPEGDVTTACTPICGDGRLEPTEACDDGNLLAQDGCSPTCEIEPGFGCGQELRVDDRTCGTGDERCQLLPIRYRDFEGQQMASGHPDFFFLGATAGIGNQKTICVPEASGTKQAWSAGEDCPSDEAGPCAGLVEPTLGPDGKPRLDMERPGGMNCPCVFTDHLSTGVVDGEPGVQQCRGRTEMVDHVDTMVPVIESPDTFNGWFHDSPLSTPTSDALLLRKVAPGSYGFSSSSRTILDDVHDACLSGTLSGTLAAGFFPLEESPGTKLCNIWTYWVPELATNCCAGEGCPVPYEWDPWAAFEDCPNIGTGGPVPSMAGTGGVIAGTPRNFYFTTEVHHTFQYQGGESIEFAADDDTWLFVNGRLVLDWGATHQRQEGSILLDQAGLNLQTGRVYEVAVFHADRQPRESNYEIQLNGFSDMRSLCSPSCGDGIVSGEEQCDFGLGVNRDDEYGGCSTTCRFNARCGDGEVQAEAGELCDNGSNLARYGEADCGPGCRIPARCGDGSLDANFGEECDEGDANGSSFCTATCRLDLP